MLLLFDKTVARNDEAARHFFDALREQFFHAAAAGKLEAWRAAGHSTIDLLADLPGVEFAKRSDFA
jgi:hypothetical protein